MVSLGTSGQNWSCPPSVLLLLSPQCMQTSSSPWEGGGGSALTDQCYSLGQSFQASASLYRNQWNKLTRILPSSPQGMQISRSAWETEVSISQPSQASADLDEAMV